MVTPYQAKPLIDLGLFAEMGNRSPKTLGPYRDCPAQWWGLSHETWGSFDRVV